MKQLVWGIAVASVLVGCGDGGGNSHPGAPDAAPEPAAITYYRDIKPIVDAKCVRCHHEGGIAPMPLETVDDVQTYAGVALLNIQAGYMPPWPPNDDCNDYVANRSLSDEHKQLFADWVDLDMPAGDPGDSGPPIEVEELQLSRVDQEIAMPVAYAPRQSPDDYRCFLIPWPEEYTERVYVTGFNTVPGNRAIVHHVIAFLAEPSQVSVYRQLEAEDPEPGYTCFGGTRGPSFKMIGGWAPGSNGSDTYPGTGLPVDPGSMIVLQMHYNTLNGADDMTDLTTMQLKIDTSVEREAVIAPFVNPQWVFGGNMPIPAGDPDVMHSFTYDAPTFVNRGNPFVAYSATLHMHQLGSHGTLSLVRANGDTECLLQIDDWDFDWQGNYALREPIFVEPGDQLRIECHWDNSPENQPLIGDEPRTPIDVNWGDGTTDEMCIGFLYAADP